MPIRSAASLLSQEVPIYIIPFNQQTGCAHGRILLFFYSKRLLCAAFCVSLDTAICSAHFIFSGTIRIFRRLCNICCFQKKRSLSETSFLKICFTALLFHIIFLSDTVAVELFVPDIIIKLCFILLILIFLLDLFVSLTL